MTQPSWGDRMTWTLLPEMPESGEPAPAAMHNPAPKIDFSWDDARAELAGLPDGGLNIAFEAVDRWVAAGWGEQTALRWLGKNGDRREFSYADLARLSNCFANLLERLGVGLSLIHIFSVFSVFSVDQLFTVIGVRIRSPDKFPTR